MGCVCNKIQVKLALFSAPDGGPLNLTAKAIRSTAILVSWDKIRKDTQNGIIKEYRITYSPTNGSPRSTQSEIVNASVQEMQLQNLSVYTEYKISVSGRTIAGFGAATEVILRTQHKGMMRFADDYTSVSFCS